MLKISNLDVISEIENVDRVPEFKIYPPERRRLKFQRVSRGRYGAIASSKGMLNERETSD